MDIFTYGSQREIQLSQEEFTELENFHPSSKAPNNEGSFKLIKIDGQTKLIKTHYYTRKMDTIKTNLNILITYKESIKQAIPELLLPEDYVYINDKTGVSYTLKPLKWTNLYDVIYDDTVSPRKKIDLLRKVGKTINRFGNIPNFPYSIYIGDLHEGNIMVTKNKKIIIIDTLSCYINNNICEPQASKYLELSNEILNNSLMDKYKQSYGIIIPNRNTDIFCYIYMILNTIASTETIFLSLKDLYNYLDYLEHHKFNKDFLYSIVRLFTKEDNINPYEFISTITRRQFECAHYLTYKRKTGIDLSNL